jgi:hypothetical protein
LEDHSEVIAAASAPAIAARSRGVQMEAQKSGASGPTASMSTPTGPSCTAMRA